MPFTGKIEPAFNPVSNWDAENEELTPYYYSKWPEDYKMTIEFTPGAKAGYFRIKFPEGTKKIFFFW